MDKIMENLFDIVFDDENQEQTFYDLIKIFLDDSRKI